MRRLWSPPARQRRDALGCSTHKGASPPLLKSRLREGARPSAVRCSATATEPAKLGGPTSCLARCAHRSRRSSRKRSVKLCAGDGRRCDLRPIFIRAIPCSRVGNAHANHLARGQVLTRRYAFVHADTGEGVSDTCRWTRAITVTIDGERSVRSMLSLKFGESLSDSSYSRCFHSASRRPEGIASGRSSA